MPNRSDLKIMQEEATATTGNNTLRELVEGNFSVTEFNRIHIELKWNKTWLQRKLDTPGSIKKEQLIILSNILRIPIAVLMDTYGVAMDTMTAAEADELRKRDLADVHDATATEMSVAATQPAK